MIILKRNPAGNRERMERARCFTEAGGRTCLTCPFRKPRDLLGKAQFIFRPASDILGE